MKTDIRHRLRRYTGACAFSLSFIVCTAALAQQNIGDAQIVVNDVKGVVTDREPAVLRVGIDIFQNEVIRTGNASATRVLFQDNTNLSIGSQSQVTLDKFVYDPDPAKSAVALSIAKGVVRFTTGSLPKSAYRISTPAATIGVRGTIITITVADDGTTTVHVEEGVAIVTGGGQTVEVNGGMQTSVTPGGAPTPPIPPPPSPPPPVSEMDVLLADNGPLRAGPADQSAADDYSTEIIIGGVTVAIIAGVIVAITSSGSGGTSTTSSTSTR